jgi:transcriptional regulator with PAS, ATPase and Fis domain
MLIAVKTDSGKSYFVLENSLSSLIETRKIREFRRSNGWLSVDEDQRREERDGYDGPERRVSRIVNSSLFPLSIGEQLRRGHSVEAVIGYGERAREMALKLKSVAKTNLSVLIQGKTGTGKGVVASIIHELSKRKDEAFVRVDCGTIPPTLIESELFGYEKGSFTGASRSKPGKFQLAKGGTIFLDEIANLSMEMQTRLLGFLEERVVNSIGGVSPIKLDVRVISATNADLAEQIRSYQFREDLFYRLNEFEIQIPPLRERPDDIFYLATKFLLLANAELEKHIFGFSEAAIDFLSGYPWRGNIRELKNLIKRATLAAEEVIEAEHLLSNAPEEEITLSLDCWVENALVKGRPLYEINDTIRRIAEKKIIERVYEKSHKNKRRTCEALGINYSTLFRKMKEYSIPFYIPFILGLSHIDDPLLRDWGLSVFKNFL